MEQGRSLEESLEELRVRGAHGLTLGQVIGVLSGHSLFLLLMLLVLPFCQPLQIPGLSVPFGLTVMVLGVRMILGKDLWLPKKLLAKHLSAKGIQRLCHGGMKVLGQMRRWSLPRIGGLTGYKWSHRVNGVVVFFCGLVLAIPLPIPLMNMLPGWAILLISFGLVNADGVFLLIGYSLFGVLVVFLTIVGIFLRHWL